ncbi:MAG: glycoside hydrolase family 44 protein [Polyangia bacterium]
MSMQALYRCALLGLTFGACIKRTAPPPSSAGSEPPQAAQALEAANARIANVPRIDLLGGRGTRDFTLQGDVQKVEVSQVSVHRQPFGEATRLRVKEGSGLEYSVQLQAPTTAPVEAGDFLLATFYLRTEMPKEDGVGETSFVFELGKPPYTKSVEYPVQAPAQWTKVQIRFQSVAAYAVGEAHMNFHLGYEPETIDLAGVTVEDFGKRLPLSQLPNTRAADRRREKANTVAAAERDQAALAGPPVEGGDLRFEVKPKVVIRAISPYVYGINSQKNEGFGATLRRMGGNRQTAYNWEINASNAGNDYQHSSDEWACTAMGYRNCSTPGAQFLDFVSDNRTAGMESIVTIPLVDYVSADKHGSVAENEKAPSPRWVRSYPKKPGPFALSPDLADDKVFQDEFVNLLVNKLGKAAQGGAKFYSLDNEPALWPSTHPRVHPERTTYREMIDRSEATADAILRVDPDAIVLGGVMFGWSEFMTLDGAPDADEGNKKYERYLDYFLAESKKLEAKHGKRLIHALDVHWYPEDRGTKRITEKDVSPRTVAARLQAPRSLWDPDYKERTGIGSSWGKPLRLIPWLLERIAERYPGTKLAMTEYNFGAGEHISGGLAQVDLLGIFGREGMYLANYWGDGAGNTVLPPYTQAAYRLYRNYDGKNGRFGDTAVAATTDNAKASIYAALDSKKALSLIVINKELHTAFTGKIHIAGADCKSADVFVLDGTGPTVRPMPAVAVKDEQIEYRLPPLSATLFVCRP